MISKNNPSLRFKNFDDNWKKSKLGENTGFITKGTTPKSQLDKGEVNFVKVENLVNNQILPALKISKDEHENYLKRSRLEKNDILFSIAGTLGRVAPVDENILPANTNQALAILRNYNFNKQFLLTSLSGRIVKEYIRKNPTIGAQPNISLKQVGDLPISFPSLPEQSAIGSLFQTLDELLSAYKDNLANYQAFKASMLSKMFPKAGQTTPEIRLDGFQGEWEEVMVKNLANKTFGGGTPKTSVEEYWGGNLNWIQSSDLIEHEVQLSVTNKTITEQGLKESAAKLVPKDSIAIVTRVGVGKLALVPFEFATSQDFLSISDLTVDKHFALYVLYRLLQKEKDNVQGTSIKGITKDDLLHRKITITNNVAEQKALGKFFLNLDYLISSYQEKIDHLETLKKKLLQDMFI